ncbi:MAG: hypothetical protein ABW049_09115 [Spongiibacteraceae bacterium]
MTSFSYFSWPRRTLLDRMVLLGIVVGSLLLFVHQPGPEQHRLWSLFWDCGHVFLFAGVGYLVGERWLQGNSWLRFVGWLALAALIGWIIELLQLLTGRDYSLRDVAADTIGMALGLFVGGRTHLRLQRLGRVVICAILALALAERFLPVARAAIDAVSAANAFPELANFSTGFAPSLQLDRFKKNHSSLSVGDGALRIELSPAQYTGFGLDDFPSDWQGWHWLSIDLTNTGPAQQITCRIHDAAHEQRDYAHNDRFNRQFVLRPGNNRLRIDLREVEHAPRDRLLDLRNIRDFSCYTTDLKTPQVWLLRSITLE